MDRKKPAEEKLRQGVEGVGEAAEPGGGENVKRAALERERLLIAQHQHHVRNMLATVRSIIQRSAQTSDTVEDMSMHLQGRIDSLSRTQTALSRSAGGVYLEDLLRDEVLAQSVAEDRIQFKGPAVRLPPKAAEVLMFVMHELLINAIKYGALRDGGKIAIVWRVNSRDGEQWLHLSWTESGVQVLGAAPRREGFGTELITRRVPYELRGKGTLEFHPGGLRSTIEFPLRAGESIFETGQS